MRLEQQLRRLCVILFLFATIGCVDSIDRRVQTTLERLDFSDSSAERERVRQRIAALVEEWGAGSQGNVLLADARLFHAHGVSWIDVAMISSALTVDGIRVHLDNQEVVDIGIKQADLEAALDEADNMVLYSFDVILPEDNSDFAGKHVSLVRDGQRVSNSRVVEVPGPHWLADPDGGE